MTNFICRECGTQFAQSEEPPGQCAICQDARQFVPISGQKWTTLDQLRTGHRNTWQEHEPGLLGVGTTPEFAIGQRALFLRSTEGNFLWDCLTLIDRATIEIIQSFGGLRGIAVSHPHYYTTVVEWSRAFGGAPIYLHHADQEWVMRPDDSIQFWADEEKELAPGVRLIRCGGHFPGGTILHWQGGAEGRGALLTGDILQVTPDGMVSFMFSYPNLTPLPATTVQSIGQKVGLLSFDRIYGAFWERIVRADGAATVRRSVDRYLAALDSSVSSSGREETLSD